MDIFNAIGCTFFAFILGLGIGLKISRERIAKKIWDGIAKCAGEKNV